MLEIAHQARESGGIRSVFVTHNALSEHIGTAQILPYLEGLAGLGHHIDCISVEPRTSDWDRRGEWKSRLASAGVGHHPLHRSSGRLYALERFFISARLTRQLARTVEVAHPDLLHCRSYMPLSAVIRVSALHKIPFLFDMRGFWIDQRIEGGSWNPEKRIWRSVIGRFRAIESKAISEARAMVTLTEDAKDLVMRRPDYRGADITVIPCSVRDDIFRPHLSRVESRARLGIKDKSFVIAYLGSAGSLYRLDVVYRLWREMRKRGLDAAILFVGNHEFPDHATAAARIGVSLDRERTFFTKLPHHRIPEALAAADIGVSPIIQSLSSVGVSATKVGEYLACGLPVISNDGVGDIRRIITDGENGFVLPDFSDASVSQCVERIVASPFAPREEISRRSTPYFGMGRALAAYDDLYRRIGSRAAP